MASRLFADVCVAMRTVEALRAAGHDVVRPAPGEGAAPDAHCSPRRWRTGGFC